LVAIIFIGIVHHNILKIFPLDKVDTINKFVSPLMQILGGVIILVNINSNLGLFKQDTLIPMFLNWLKLFPLFRKIRPVTGNINGILPPLSSCFEVHTSQVCKTIEEKVEENKRQIDELRKIVYREEKELLKKISKSESNLKTLIYKNQNRVNKIEKSINKYMVGGINTQIFGVFLVLYGAIFPLI